MNKTSSAVRKAMACLVLVLAMSSLPAQNGSGHVVTEDRQLSNFSFIQVEDGIDVHLSPGQQTRVSIQADDNLLSKLKTQVSGNTLKISMDGTYRKAEKLEVHIVLPHLEGIEASGGSDVYSTTPFDLNELKIKLSGGSDIRFDLAAEKIYCDLSGGSDADLSGKVGYFSAETSGGSDLKAKSLEVKKCKLLTSGGSDAYVWVLEELEMEASGASDIYYHGRPNILYQKSSGGSDIHSSN